MPSKKEWTLIFYLASDNPLAPSVISQLKSIKAAGFHKQANVIVQFDPQSEATPTHVFDVNVIQKADSDKEYNIGFTEKDDPFVHSLLEDKLWRHEKDRHGTCIRKCITKQFPTYDPGYPPNGTISDDGEISEIDPQTSLDNFLKFCAESYPANHYVLFLLGHGVVVGNDIFMYDQHAVEHTLSLGGLRTVLTDFNTRIGNQGGSLELISFHSCSVSSLEVAYELKDLARYMLASQGTALVGNWPYRQIVMRIFKELAQRAPGQDMAVEAMFEEIFSYCVNNSTDFLLAGYPFDLCLCDLRELEEMKAALETLSKALMKGLNCRTFADAILLAHLEAQSFHSEMYTDIVDFCRCLYARTSDQNADPILEKTRTGIQDAIVDVITVIRNCVVRSAFAGPEYQYARGLSLYFPWSSPVDDFLETYAVYKLIEPSADRVTWLHFLKDYFHKTQRKPISYEKANPITELHEKKEPPSANAAELELIEDQLAVVYGQAEPLSAASALDNERPHKTDTSDPMGSSYSTPSIKNYPRDTRKLKERKQPRERFPLCVPFLWMDN
jgi:hypothetical protein